MEKSIFDFDDKLGYTSPFGNWTTPIKSNIKSSNKSEISVANISGPNVVCESAVYEFIVNSLNLPLKELNISGVVEQLNWGYEIDDTGIKTINQKAIYSFTKNEIVLKWKIPKTQNGQFLKVYAWTENPDMARYSTSMILNFPFDFKSYRVAGKSADYAKAIAEDMCYGDGVTKTEHFAYDLEVTKTISTDIENFIKSEPNELFHLFEEMVTNYFSTGELENVIKDMIKTLSNNKGVNAIEFYQNDFLTKTVREHEETRYFIENIENAIKEELKKNKCNPAFLLNTSIQFNSKDDELRRPIFGNLNAKNKERENKLSILTGLTIIIHDVWSYKVKIKKFDTNDSKNYSVTYSVVLLDHFGLDIEDMKPKVELPIIGKKGYKDLDGFKAWFVLQHVKNYKPFITKIEFEESFSGTI